MTTMVEKVARAIADSSFQNWDEEMGPEAARILARAAIGALMEPTPDVEIAVDLHCNFKPWEGDGKRAWQAGVQATLKEEQ